MTDFDALLKRSFAEASEPADDGFSAGVAKAVAHNEATAKMRLLAHAVGLAAAGAAVFYGAYGLMNAFGQQFLAEAGLGIARAHGALSSAGADQSLMSIGAGMTQILLVTAALAGGAVAYRSAQD